MSDNDELTLKDLCEESGLSERTIRYYMAEGVIPPAPRSGPGVRYPRAHLTRLRLIRKWQDANLSLEQIRKLIADANDTEVERMVQSPKVRVIPDPEAAGSAADYVRKVLGKTSGAARSPTQAPRTPAPDPQDMPGSPISRSQWERFVVDEDVEIHVRRPLSHAKNRRVDALLQEARRLLKEIS